MVLCWKWKVLWWKVEGALLEVKSAESALVEVEGTLLEVESA